MGVDLMVVTVVVLLVALIWRNARLLDAADAKARGARAALRHYADEVEDLYERAPCGYHSVDADGVFVRINDTELAWLGYARDEVVGRLRFYDLLTPASRQVFHDTFPRFKAQGEIRDVEFDMCRKDGSVLPVSLSATIVRDAAGRYLKSRSTVFDITQRRRAEQALRRSEEQARLRLAEIEQIYRYAPVGLFIFDREYRFVRINERMAEINGFPPEAHIGRSMWDMVPDLAAQLMEIYRPVYERGEPVLDVEIHGRTARDPEHDHDWLASYFPLKSDSGEVVGMIGVVLDITERKRTEQALRESEAAIRALALTDALTGLANRRRLDEALRTEIQRAQRYGGRLSAVITDLDHFKRINDEHGHEVGDHLLHEFARIIRAHCRETDLVARFGGEEFVILMPEVGATEAQACAERMRAALDQTILSPLRRPVTATFGVAEFVPEESEGSLLRRADKALYRGKAAGRNCVVMAEAADCPAG
jgi:diguanylate cyclase (GGDEF)-like protein/PAS domain S-box-containing protein